MSHILSLTVVCGSFFLCLWEVCDEMDTKQRGLCGKPRWFLSQPNCLTRHNYNGRMLV